MQEVIFKATNLRKEFGPTIALNNVDFEVRRGEIHGLIGENGSGKSTIMSIAAGMQPATSGSMEFLGKPWKPGTMVQAQKLGLSMILQEANTIPGVSVASNLFAGREDLFSTLGFINMPKMNKAADKLLQNFNISNIKGKDLIDIHTFEDRKLIEIVRCVTDDTELLVVDETTTALSFSGRAILYDLIHKLAEEGKAVVFISHDMDEIMEQCTCVTVLRDGNIIGSLTREEMNDSDAPRLIRNMMVGREIGNKYYREDFTPSHNSNIALKLDNISFGHIKDFNLELHGGEIIGLGGLSGCGMHDIGRAAYGLIPLKSGKVERCGITIDGCLKAISNGIGYISKDRDTEALALEAPIGDNIALPSWNYLSKITLISPSKERELIEHEINSLSIKCHNRKQWVNTLSGGNKQKVSFAKWTALKSDVLIMDCPTRGVDIGVKQAMYTMIENMKAEGKAILMISEELSELIGMADKIIIMRDFKVTKEFERSASLKQTDIIEYMI